jgi:DNA-binding NarL/FixJ family response regulator
VVANRALVLMIGVPGRIQESLRTMLKAVPDLEVLEVEQGHWPSAKLRQEKPDLVLLDSGLPAEEVAWIKANWPSTGCLVLSDTTGQMQRAKAAGADAALLRGFTGNEFFATLRGLLKDKILLDCEPGRPSREYNGDGLETSPGQGEGRPLRVRAAVI